MKRQYEYLPMNEQDKGLLIEEQYRYELEKRRSGMPGAIHRGRLGWTRVRRDKLDHQVAQCRSPELD